MGATFQMDVQVTEKTPFERQSPWPLQQMMSCFFVRVHTGFGGDDDDDDDEEQEEE